MLIPGLEQMDLTAPLAELAEQGYARLGRVLDQDGLAALRGRAEDLMLGRVCYPGLFFQLDATTGNYEDAPIGLGWQGPSIASSRSSRRMSGSSPGSQTRYLSEWRVQ
jgi:phytanoyl-CoA hydroxylase